MKKIIFLAVLTLAAAVCVFAQSYTVQEVKGRVQKESGASRVDVQVGEVLDANTVLHTGVGVTLVLKSGDKTFSVASAKSGKVSELVTSAAGVRIGGNIARTDTDAVSRTTAQTSTASARASDAAGDKDIAAE